MEKFSVSNASQCSLLNYLHQADGLIAEISLPGRLPPVVLRSALDLSSRAFPLTRSHVYVGQLRNVVLAKRKYFVTPDNNFLAEGLTHSDYFITWSGFDDSGLGRGSELVKTNAQIHIGEASLESFSEPCIFIGGDTINEPNFAHWFFEHLLKLQALRMAGVNLSLPVIVSSRLPRRFLEWAEILLEKSINWISLNLDGYVKFSSVIVSSCPAYRRKIDAVPTIWDGGFDFLHDVLSALVGPSVNKSVDQGVYFISRSDASWRRAVNEEELFEIARRELGAIKISMSKLSIQEQVALVKRAEVLILFAGADGPITTFCNPRCRVIEFAAPNHVALYTSPVFCATRGVRWSRVVAEKFVTEVRGPHPLDADYWVNPELARKCFKELSAAR